MAMLAGDARYLMAYGGSRSGKTFGLCKALLIRASKTKSRHAILRLKFNHAKTSIWMDTLPKVASLCFPGLVTHDNWNKTDYCLNLSNGSEIWVGGLDDAQRVEKILGKEYSTLYFNECSQIPYRSINVALTRLAEKNDLVKRAYFDMNPPTKRHWSYNLWIRGISPDDETQPVDRSEYASILMNPSDNIENIDGDYIVKILDRLPEKERARFKDGVFADADDGQAYYAFDRDTHLVPCDKKHSVGTLCVGMDFNVNPMTAVVGYVQDKIFRVIDEIYLPNSDTPKMVAELIKRGYRGATVFPDSTGKNRKTSGRSDFDTLRESGFTIQATRNPLVRDRVTNTNRLLTDGRIEIDPKCRYLINDLEKVAWVDNELDKKSDPSLTHVSDALGYWLWSIEQYAKPGAIVIG
jgi:phage terminase large subunit